MDLNIKIGDRIKLIYDVREFNIIEYLDINHSYSFDNIQLNIPESSINLDIQDKEFLPFKAPIILFDYEEELLNITLENNRKIGYTKSFRIDLLRAIEGNEIIVNDVLKHKSELNKISQLFINELLRVNQNFAFGLNTKSERKSQIFSSFLEFYNSAFKDELEQIRGKEKIRKSNLTDEHFFSENWKRHLPKKDFEGIKTKLNNIIFAWIFPQPKLGWIKQFLLEGIEKGIDKRTNVKLTIGGLYISKERFRDNSKQQVSLCISASRNVEDKLIYKVDFWDKKDRTEEIEIINLWENIEFKKMLNRIIESEVY